MQLYKTQYMCLQHDVSVPYSGFTEPCQCCNACQQRLWHKCMYFCHGVGRSTRSTGWSLTWASHCATQLREFYGPLLACITATKAAYDAMVKQHSPDGTLQGLKKAAEADPHGTEAKAYRSDGWGRQQGGPPWHCCFLRHEGVQVLGRDHSCKRYSESFAAHLHAEAGGVAGLMTPMQFAQMVPPTASGCLPQDVDGGGAAAIE